MYNIDNEIITKIIAYIQENFCNYKNLNDCWHPAMQDILDIIDKDKYKKED